MYVYIYGPSRTRVTLILRIRMYVYIYGPSRTRVYTYTADPYVRVYI